MKKVEIVIVCLGLVAAVLRLFSIEGGVLFTTIFLGLLWIFYLLLSYPLLNRGNKFTWPRLLLSIGAGIALSTAVVGILFRLNHWDGGAFLQVISTVLLLTVIVVSLIQYVSVASMFYANILIRGGILLLINVAMIVWHWF